MLNDFSSFSFSKYCCFKHQELGVNGKSDIERLQGQITSLVNSGEELKNQLLGPDSIISKNYLTFEAKVVKKLKILILFLIIYQLFSLNLGAT